MNTYLPKSLKSAAALVVMALTCACLAEDLLTLSRCAEERGPVFLGGSASAVGQSQSPEQSRPPNSSEGDHDCLCCCRHLVPGVVFCPAQNWLFSFLESSQNQTARSAHRFPPYHPPQA